MQIIPQDHAEFVTQVADAIRFDPRPVRIPPSPRHRWMAVMDGPDGPEPLSRIACAWVGAILVAASALVGLAALMHLP